MQPSDMFVLFVLWCVTGWLIYFVLEFQEVPTTLRLYETLGYKKAAAAGRVFVILLWPVGPLVVLWIGKKIDSHMRKHGRKKDK